MVSYQIKRQDNDVYAMIQDLNGTNVTPMTEIELNFTITSPNTTCYQAVDTWSNITCKSKILNDTITCICKEFGYIAAIQMPLLNINVDVIGLPVVVWSQAPVVYLFSSYSLVTIILAIWGFKRDILDKVRIHPFDDDEEKERMLTK